MLEVKLVTKTRVVLHFLAFLEIQTVIYVVMVEFGTLVVQLDANRTEIRSRHR